MTSTICRFKLILAFVVTFSGVVVYAENSDLDATNIVRNALNHWRGLSSHGEMTMIIHRPDWERTMSIVFWSKGETSSLVRVTAPRKDRGSGTLIEDKNMWTFSPKVNRIIKVPSSMMSQSWMGSDFSNKDISRTDDIVDEYQHSLLSKKDAGGFSIFEIQLTPNEDAAVVWGRLVLEIRDDNVLMEERYYDQDDRLVQTLRSVEIREMGGRTVATRQRMIKADAPEEWTEVIFDSMEFDLELDATVFTLSNLRNPRN
ncbi:uncharacterized protein METZ01_LOCUS350729 [marine metagenome]|uniref:Uncharacterized protein TP-0789 domain-containing protein n=1 Tax=marine metagenome TaxID=408172 RepID=A0A382RL30_9ZZZZ